ncbi:MAG: molybdopterin-guanine dinucleotide biosynthesis protein MobB [Spirochaetaceae bacterium]|nr:molybdopterin-guanine dinucleotide biosynthesis protein MobB [Spirochaetaceae bacterium]
MRAKERFISILGWSGSGKTSLLVEALRECSRRGIVASAAKCAHHDPDAAPAGKDSTLFQAAGARASLYIGERGMARFQAAPEIRDRAFFDAQFPEEDLIFLEGLTIEGALRVLTGGAARTQTELKFPLDEIDVLVSDDEALRAAALEAGAVALRPGDAAALIDLAMEEQHGT